MQKTILVTGANRGIGKEISRQLIEKGHTVWIASRDISKAQSTASELGSNALPVQLDVTSQDDINQAFQTIDSKHGKLDVLVNNAGVMSREHQIIGSMVDIRKTMETNFFGAMEVTQILAPLLANSEEGRVINISSGLGAWADLEPSYAGYRLSKVALNALTVMFSKELIAKNIMVNSVCPGWVKTNMGGDRAPLNVEQGADTAVWLATELVIPTGKFFRARKEISF